MVKMFYDLLYSLPVSLLGVMIAGTYFGLLEPGREVYLITVVISVALAGFRYLEKRLEIMIPSVLAVVFIGILLIRQPEERMALLLQYSYVGWILLLALVAYLLGRLVSVTPWIRRLAGLFFLGLAGYALWFDLQPEKAMVALVFFQLLVYLAEEVQSGWKKSGYTDRKAHLVFVAPFLIAIGLAVYFLPSPEKAYDWELARRIWETAVERAKWTSRFLPGDSEEFGDLGFSEHSGIVGAFQKNGKEVLDMTPSKKCPPVIYLPGKTFNTFDGRQWISTDESTMAEKKLDFLETQAAVRKYDMEFFSDYLEVSRVNLKYRMFRTRNLFVPLKTVLDDRSMDKVSYTVKGGEMLAERKQGYNTEYNMSYYRMNKDHPVFRDLILDAEEIDETLWDKTLFRNFIKYKDDCSYQDYLAYKDMVKEVYTSAVEPSEEVKQLVEEICEGAETDYDRLKCIEAYIGSMKYSGSPGKLPGKVNSAESFLDYFLLEKKEGYCVHFATAFSLLARAEGYPTRCVQGFAVTTDKDTTIVVTNDMAHTWPEVYIENIGWIPFEPTPGYYHATSWKTKEEIEAERGDSSVEYVPARPEAPYVEPHDPDELEDWEDMEEENKISINPVYIILPPTLGILFLIGFLTVDSVINKKKFGRLDAQGKGKAYCKQNIKLLQFLGYPMEEGETLEEFGKRIQEAYEKMCEGLEMNEKDDFAGKGLAFIPCYEEYLYAGNNMTEQKWSPAEESNKALRELLKAQKGKTYLLYKLRVDRVM